MKSADTSENDQRKSIRGHIYRRTADLLIGRTSVPGASYFLTVCEANRRPRLTQPLAAAAVKRAFDEFHAAGDFSMLAATVMPDHLHLLGLLGSRLPLSRLMGKLKAVTNKALSSVGAVWQENFYDHRLRPADAMEAYALYMFLNPYRAGLIQRDERWPYWWRWGDIRFSFEESVIQGGAVPEEWLNRPSPSGVKDL